ncbi:hypothetical protein PYCCODRAFT_1185289 [Trametes coccinea BRFM310]|uniref:Uncharacterized protein n=1 Tax=Trametes coccinea (strain BRFM310) TaxID=1353009 RepID=A0A1Y2I919_TRAC3|nr:hypothetical protein PYCCODRAFT_1185289 [Trametes coccinea BRFM310]
MSKSSRTVNPRPRMRTTLRQLWTRWPLDWTPQPQTRPISRHGRRLEERLRLHGHMTRRRRESKLRSPRSPPLSFHHDSTKAARLTPYRTPAPAGGRSTLVSGLRSEHSNPSRSTLAGSGLNRPRVAPEIQSPHRSPRGAPERPRLVRARRGAHRGGVRGLWDTAQGSGARFSAPVAACGLSAGPPWGKCGRDVLQCTSRLAFMGPRALAKLDSDYSGAVVPFMCNFFLSSALREPSMD